MFSKNILLLSVTLVLMASGLHGQEIPADEDTLVEAPVDTSTKPRNNELGINVSQVAIFLLGGEYERQFNFTYKRKLGTKLKIRAGLNYVQSEDFNILQKINDTISTSNHSDSIITVSLGIEWAKTIEKATVFYGLDITGSQYWAESEFNRFTRIPSISTTDTFALDFERYIWNTSRIGISPFVGVGYSLSPRVFISLQTNLLFAYETGKRKVTEGNVTTTTSVSKPLFYFSPVINNFSINFTF